MTVDAILGHVCRHPRRLAVTLVVVCGLVFALPIAIAAAAAG